MWCGAELGAGRTPSPPGPGVPGELPAPPRCSSFSLVQGNRSGHMCPIGSSAKCWGLARAGYRHDLVPRPVLSSPLLPPCLGTGRDPVSPFLQGQRMWQGAKVHAGVLSTHLMLGGGHGAPWHGRAPGSHCTSVGSTEPVYVPKHRAGDTQCPPQERLQGDGVDRRRPPPPVFPVWVFAAHCPSHWGVMRAAVVGL